MTKGWKLLILGLVVVVAAALPLGAAGLVTVQNQRAEGCKKFSRTIRQTVRRGDKQTQDLHIKGFGPKQRRRAHREALRTIREFSDRSCDASSSLP
jgi:hypothetical protein